MRVPDLSSLRRVAVPLAFGGNSEQQHTYFAELHRVGLVTQVMGIIAYSLTWLMMPAPYHPNLLVSFSLLRLRNYHAKVELTRLAFQDSLTGLNNRRMFTQRAQQMHDEPQGGMLHFLMIDIDNFKIINDQQGHDAGDAVLVRTAAIIADKTQGHLCGRLGGEEFGIVYAGSREDAGAFAGGLVEAVSQAFLAAQFVSISVGVAELDRGKELGHSYRLADEALYLAKRQGKNRYVIA